MTQSHLSEFITREQRKNVLVKELATKGMDLHRRTPSNKVRKVGLL